MVTPTENESKEKSLNSRLFLLDINALEKLVYKIFW